MKIERFDLDASGKPCSEGYYAVGPRGLILMPPTGEMAAGLRLATQAEVDTALARGPIAQATAECIANCDPAPSDARPAAEE